MSETNERWAGRLLERLWACGVREFCVCSGARCAPLLVALARMEGAVVWRFFEERSAGFFAVGRAMATGRAVAVITTSGTAAAELLPAAVEARYGGVGLVLVTADRPRAFRGSGAPQAIEQVGLLDGAVMVCHDLAAGEEVGGVEVMRDAPVQVNVCFGEPLLGPGEGSWDGGGGRVFPVEREGGGDEAQSGVDGAKLGKIEGFLKPGEGGLLVAVAGLRERVEVDGVAGFLARLGAPVLAEATANLGDRVAGLEIDEAVVGRGGRWPGRVMRVGSVPSGRWWRDLEEQGGIEVASVGRACYGGLARGALHVTGSPALLGDLAGIEGGGQGDWDWLGEGAHGGGRGKGGEAGPILRAVAQAIPDGARLFLGNSLTIREWNRVCPNRAELWVGAARGANGIDGQISCGLGWGAEAEELWVVVGDLTALYDMAGPWVGGQLAGRVRLVVWNNGGGRIFDRLPGLADAPEGARAAMRSGHALGFEGLARLWGWGYGRASAAGQVGGLIAELAGEHRALIELADG